MHKTKIGFEKWPFAKGERVKLIRISKPYVEEGIWYLDALYLSDNTNRVCTLKHHFGDLHLLISNADYVDGRRQNMPEWKAIDVYLSKSLINAKKPKPFLIQDKKKKSEFNYYTFGIKYGDNYLVIPLHEILRAVLTPDIFWLNQVTLLDSIDTRVVYGSDSNDLRITFLSDVPLKYVQLDEKIKHAAWIFSNQEIFTMIHQAYHNIRNEDGIKFDFLFEELHLTVKVEQKDKILYVKEIVSVKGKKIRPHNIIVEHPGLVEYEKDGIPKEKKWIPIGMAEEKKSLVSGQTAAPGILDIDRYHSVQSEYSSVINIKRTRRKRASGTRMSLQTTPIAKGVTHKRTTADFGGLDTVPQIEFENHVEEKYEGLFSDIIPVFKLMEKRDEVISIGYHIGDLNDHYKYRSICTLADNLTTRKYLAGIIQLSDGKGALFIEIQRDKIALSTLILVFDANQKWRFVCHQIIKRLIINSGSWPEIEPLGIGQLEFYKFKHTNADVKQKENRIFSFIYSGK